MLGTGIGLATDAYRTVCYVEREAYAAAVLAARIADGALDDAPIWSDVTTFDGAAWRGCVDLIIGGYPCQPFSVAGKRLGTDDPRHIWPHIFRHVEQAGPEWCFFENVGGHLRLGYFDVVKPDLESIGYRVEETLIEAQDVTAPHKRERLFIMAHRDSGGRREQPEPAPRRRDAHGSGEQVADAYARRRGAAESDDDARQSDARGRSGESMADADGRAAGRTAGQGGRRAARPDGRASGSGEGVADAGTDRGDARPDGSRREQPERDGRELADTGHAEQQGRRDDARGSAGEARRKSASRSSDVGDAEREGLGQVALSRSGQRPPTESLGPSASLFPAGAGGPGTADYEQWRAILAERPELAPALESPVYVVADGMADLLGIAYAHRRSWLRLTGNGVVAQQVALAFALLARRFGWDVTEDWGSR